MCVFVTPPDRRKNYRDLKFGTYPPVDHIKHTFFKKLTRRGHYAQKTAASCGFAPYLLKGLAVNCSKFQFFQGQKINFQEFQGVFFFKKKG